MNILCPRVHQDVAYSSVIIVQMLWCCHFFHFFYKVWNSFFFLFSQPKCINLYTEHNKASKKNESQLWFNTTCLNRENNTRQVGFSLPFFCFMLHTCEVGYVAGVMAPFMSTHKGFKQAPICNLCHYFPLS